MGLFTLDDLRRIMRAVGVDGTDVDLDGPIDDVPFAGLGYDSLAVLETQVRISNEYGVRIPDDAVAEMTTPAAAVRYVDDLLSTVGSR
jgi:minimal PKS acyl carrier protein